MYQYLRVLMQCKIASKVKSKRGQGMVEYGVILGVVVAIGVAISISGLGGKISAMFDGAVDKAAGIQGGGSSGSSGS